MANLLVPPQPQACQVYDRGAIIAWGLQRFPKGYTYNVYWEAGTFATPPAGALANLYESGLKATGASIRAGAGSVPIPINTNIYVAITSVTPSGVESAQSDPLYISIDNAEHNPPVAIARDDSGQPKTLLVDEDGNLVTDAAGGGGTTCTLTLQQQTDVSVTTVAADILAAPQIPSPLANRKIVIVQNDSGQDVFLGTSTLQNHKLPTGGSRVLNADDISVGMHAKLAAGGPVTVNVWEYA
jgi:hypothetical protein